MSDDRATAAAEAWARADLSYLHHDDAIPFWELVRDSSESIFTQRCGRRYGKSLGCVVDAVEYGINPAHERHILNYAAPTQLDAVDIVAPHFDAVLEDCPTAIRPVWRDFRLWFHTGAVLKLSGCDDRRKANRLRGRMAHRCYVDEGGSIPEINYVLYSVLLPQTLTTAGKIVLATSPSDTPAHESATIMRQAELEGRGVHRTIYAAPHLTDAQIAKIMRETVPGLSELEARAFVAEQSGPEDPVWQREYMAEIVVDTRRAVVPEFARAKATIVKALPRPSHFHSYVALDQGFHDLSFAVFAYHDFEADTLVIEDELAVQRHTSDRLDAACEEIERRLWGDREVPTDHPSRRRPDKFGRHEPARRVVDAPPIVVAELSKGVRPWVAADKDDSDAALNHMRRLFGAGKIRIHPRCVRLIDHLEYAIWNSSRTSYARPEDAERYGHFDGVDAVKYLVRAVDWQRNPFPSALDLVRRSSNAIRSGAEPPKNTASVSRLLGGRRG